MFEVANRSKESWGLLAHCSDREFDSIINNRKGNTKDLIKKRKKLKVYKVTFLKEWHTDQVELEAESDWDIGYVAANFFKDNEDKMGFKEKPRTKWADGYKGYDSIRYVQVKK